MNVVIYFVCHTNHSFVLFVCSVFRSDESRSARALAYGARLGNVATGGVGGGSGTGVESSRHRNIFRGSMDGQPGTGNMDEDEKAATDVSSDL